MSGKRTLGVWKQVGRRRESRAHAGSWASRDQNQERGRSLRQLGIRKARDELLIHQTRQKEARDPNLEGLGETPVSQAQG